MVEIMSMCDGYKEEVLRNSMICYLPQVKELIKLHL